MVMSEVALHWDLFIDVPDNDALIIGTTDQSFAIGSGYDTANPSLMAFVDAFAVTCADFPKPDGLVPRAGDDEVAIVQEVRIGHVVLVGVEGFHAHVVVIQVPELDREVGRGRDDVLAVLLVVYAIHSVYIFSKLLIWPFKLLSKSPV